MWKLKNAFIPLLVGLSVSALLYYLVRWWGFLIIFPWIGLSVTTGALLRELLVGKQRLLGRKVTLLMILPCLLLFVPIANNENFQLEGVALIVLVGFFSKGFIHYSVAKLFGPLIWRRGFCGHACWTAALLDWLPIKNSGKQLPEATRNLRYITFVISLLIPLFLVFILSYNPWDDYINKVEMKWMFISNGIYNMLAIPLAFYLKDKRAFCKYLCPVSIVMKPSSSVGLIKIGSNIAAKCIECKACTKNCPMGIDVMSLMLQNKAVTTTECIMCNDCNVVCPTKKVVVV